MTRKTLVIIFISCILHCKCFSQHNTDTSINVFFETNSFELNNHQRDTIQNFLRAYPILTCVRGYADTTGTVTNNLALSGKRALAVYKLVKGGSSRTNKNIVSYYGESSALPGRWRNRRVQICARKSPPEAKEETGPLQPGDTPSTTLDSLHAKRDTIRVINLQNLYFYPDKAILTQESVPYLHELAEQLKAYPSASFDIIGHVNYQSRLDSTRLKDLYRLSEQRAKSVYDYLAEHGISSSKMSYKGVGNSQPLIPFPKNDEEKKKNMRVQVIVIARK